MASCGRCGRVAIDWTMHRFRISMNFARDLRTEATHGVGGVRTSAATGLKLIGAFALTSASAYFAYETLNGRSVVSSLFPNSYKVLAKETGNSDDQDKTHLQRERRFLNFASVEFDGTIYMTPLDFLDSITEESPKQKAHRRHLHQSEVEGYLRNTPSKKKGSSKFFRNLLDNGLVSYTEYLFLLSVLTKPRSGFRIAFNMFDVDGDQRIDKKEFLVLEQLMANSGLSSPGSTRTEAAKTGDLLSNTTLTVHFFGQKGNDVLNYDDFHRFMENFQTEILELEFLQFSHGMPTIKEDEFARILLRYTILTKEQHEEYLERLKKRLKHVQGITFPDFKEFCQFLNNLDDFALALRIYTYADHPISEVDFRRAVKACTGQTLGSHLVHVVFQLFDEDGDGQLSQKEFISVMKERLQRGAKAVGHSHWENYKSCVKKELKSS